MKSTTSEISGKKPLLNEVKTKLFVEEILQSCQSLSFDNIYTLIVEYEIQNWDKEDSEEFYEILEEYINEWKENELIQSIDNIEPFETNCIACFFGKKVNAFNVTATQRIIKNITSTYTYTKSFAVFFEIKNNELMEFGWCNAFIEKDEIAK